jgi:hypothetical protein
LPELRRQLEKEATEPFSQWVSESYPKLVNYLKKYPAQEHVLLVNQKVARSKALGESVVCLLILNVEQGETAQCAICVGRKAYIEKKFAGLEEQINEHIQTPGVIASIVDTHF